MEHSQFQSIDFVHRKLQDLIAETGKGFIGKRAVVELAILSVLSGLHLLIEDVAGVGKTTLVHCIARATGLEFGRIQFTPDLMPGDITGMTIWDPVKREFIFREGPLRRQLILADELNRAPARTQSALLEAMQEQAVTIDGQRFPLPDPFIVAATQNPNWYAGTYKLPESQLDRFGVSMTPGYPDPETESFLIDAFKDRDAVDRVSQVASPEEITAVRKRIASIAMKEEIRNFAVSLAQATRESKFFQHGVSTRGLQHIIRLAQAHAALEAREFLIPEDILKAASPVLRHRLVLTPESRSQGRPIEHFIASTAAVLTIPIG